MFRKDAKVWVWREDPVTGRKRLKRVGPLKNLLRVDWSIVWLVLVILMLFVYIKVSQEECQSILKNPELYCPCMGEDYIITDGGWTITPINDSVEVSGVG